MENVATLILGAGAAGMMCAAQTGPDTLVIDHAKAPGEKIRISGGGRCNFTNLDIRPERFLGENPHFHKSALARYTQWDFIEAVSRHGIAWHEKTLGQLFCDDSAKQIIAMLRAEMGGAELALRTRLVDLTHDGDFVATLEHPGGRRVVRAHRLVVATGGKSIPKMGATGLAYDIARRFGHRVTDTRPALVPLTFPDGRFGAIAGVSAPATVRAGDTAFDEGMLFTHRGISGPAVLQASSYWREGAALEIDLLPGTDLAAHLAEGRRSAGKRALVTELARLLPQRLVELLASEIDLTGRLGDLSDTRIAALAATLGGWELRPTGSEGYRTAEVTLGGVATDGLSSKTMESKHVPGLYFIGEAVDVTGWLGGYNFQWAWSSGWAAGQAITAARQG
ncbi:HI0933-like protein [Roseivivax jejudonensis]|uniref:HI0933-like protein n=1 Tax=Roseivivax jejudonensis TaxID=1529041 RepID=A0A1X6ZC46_9RHOB|nr:NAD(P)/FAD-dependent oxidoreductase [Roseivivax jejudonensis]SLN47391.1 HI0933-like protein [Roseivivax jejudonensis]